MHIAQIVKIRLRGNAGDELSHSAYIRATEWLGQFTPQGNFRAVIADTREGAIKRCREMLKSTLVPAWLASAGVKPEHFVFQVSDQAVEDGLFWMSSKVVCCTDFYLKDDHV